MSRFYGSLCIANSHIRLATTAQLGYVINGMNLRVKQWLYCIK